MGKKQKTAGLGNFARAALQRKKGGDPVAPAEQAPVVDLDDAPQAHSEPVSAGSAMVGRMTGSEADSRAKVISVSLIDPDPDQPRVDFTEIEEKAETIEAHGLVHPILVRPHPSESGRYMIIDGERRFRAYRDILMKKNPLEFSEIRATVNDNVSDIGDLRTLQLIANLHRSDLNPIEEARALALIKSLKSLPTNKALAKVVGKSETRISRLLKLLQLNPDQQKKVASGEISARDVQNSKGVEAVHKPTPEKSVGRVAKVSVSMATANTLAAILQKVAAEKGLPDVAIEISSKKELIAVLESRAADVLSALK